MYLLFDIGGTNMRFAFSKNGRKLDQVHTFTTPNTYNDALAAFKKIVELVPKGQKIKQTIGGVPRFAKDKLTFWHTHPAKSAIQKIVKSPVTLMNDAELAGLGEAKYGAGKVSKILAYVTFSTGFGGVKIVNRQVDPNYFGFEPKLQISETKGNHYPSISLHTTGRGLKNTYGKPAQDLTRAVIWHAVEKWMGVALNNIATFWSPELIIVGGAVADNKHISLARLQKFLQTRFKNMPHAPKVVKSKLGQLSGLYGALSLIKK